MTYIILNICHLLFEERQSGMGNIAWQNVKNGNSYKQGCNGYHGRKLREYLFSGFTKMKLS